MAKHNVAIFIANIDQNDRWYLPIVWAYLKGYYDHFGKHPDHWNWIIPRVNPENDYNIMEDLRKNPPTVFGFSGYIWNIRQCYRVAKQVKEEFPDCVVVAGGPQPEYKWGTEFFKQNPYIDIVVPHDGEIPFTEILDTIAEGRNDFENCSNLVLPDLKNPFKGWKHSNNSVARKDFVFPPCAFIHCEDALKPLMQETLDAGRKVAAHMEFNRGCPYQCTFCDWGGGTYTKIRRKPQEEVDRELEWLSQQPIWWLAIQDANLGTFQQDVDNIQRMIDLREKTGWPHLIRYSAAKNSKDRVLKLFLILARAGANENYSHPFQDTNGEVKDIIRRKDISWEESLDIARAVRAEGFESYLQMILGLPGQTWETFYHNMDFIMGEGGLYSWPRFYQFLLLPNAPAGEPSYMSQYQIKFVERGITDELPRIRTDIPTEDFTTSASYIQKGHEDQKGWYVVETSTFSREDYVHLFTLSYVLHSLHAVEMTKLISDYLHQVHGIKYSDFYQSVYDDYILQDGGTAGEFTRHWVTHFRKWCSEETEDSYEETCIPWNDADLPFEFPGNMYFEYHLLRYRNEFFQGLKKFLVEKYDFPELASLVDYNRDNIIDFHHSPGERQIFESGYNWKEYFEEDADLLKEKVRYEILDETVTYGYQRGVYPIDWQNAGSAAEKNLQFLYRVAYSRHNSGRYAEVIRLPPL